MKCFGCKHEHSAHDPECRDGQFSEPDGYIIWNPCRCQKCSCIECERDRMLDLPEPPGAP
jgi:hypothetical protein